HALYCNESTWHTDPAKRLVSFQHATAAAGIAGLGQIYVGWGTAFIDFDLDGREDLFVANGHAIRYPANEAVGRGQKPVLLRNMGKGMFKDISRQIGPYGTKRYLGRGVAFGDLNNDGRPDLVISAMNEPITILRTVAGKGRHWLGVQLAGKDHADVGGARGGLAGGGRKQTG